MSLGAYLAVSSILFILGLAIVASRRNLIYVLMGLEMVLNAANLNFVAFNRFRPDSGLDGQLAAVFIIILAAAEAALALAIVLNIFSLFDTIRPDDVDTLKD